VLTHLLEEDVTDYRSVSEVIHAYSNDPTSVIERIEDGELGDDPLAELSEASRR